MEIHLILIVFIVCCGFTPGQQDYLVDSEAATTEMMNGKNGVQQNFRNLFNSISKNDVQKAGSFREILEQEAAREQRAFDMVKEVETERRRNAREQKNFLENRNSDRKAAAELKRKPRAPKWSGTTLSDSEQRKEWNEEFARLQTVKRSKIIEEYFSQLEEAKKHTKSTQPIELYSPSAERRYWWDSLGDLPDYPDEPHIKAGMFTGTTLTWPDEETNGTTISTTFRFTKSKHKIPSGMIGKRKHTRRA